jgi:hypothetical protein
MADHSLVQDAQPGFVNLRVKMVGVYPKNAAVMISDDYEVTDITAKGQVSAGEVLDPAPAADGYGTICSRYRRVMTGMHAAGNIPAGAIFQSSTDDTDVQRFELWDADSDDPEAIIGQALTAAGQAGDTFDGGLF